MPQPQDKNALIAAVNDSFAALKDLVRQTDMAVLESSFVPTDSKSKCTTFAQGDNLRDLLMHAYEWQRLQSDFVSNIRKGTPKDFIPEPYRKNYKEMDAVNFEKDKSVPLDQALALLDKSHGEMVALIESFSESELFEKKVFKVTYTTTMAAYFLSVTVSPYTQTLKRLKTHIRSMKMKK